MRTIEMTTKATARKIPGTGEGSSSARVFEAIVDPVCPRPVVLSRSRVASAVSDHYAFRSDDRDAPTPLHPAGADPPPSPLGEALARHTRPALPRTAGEIRPPEE